MSGMRIVSQGRGGPFATLAVAATILVAILLGAAVGAMVLAIASLFAAGALLASALPYWLRRRSGPDFASWSVDVPSLEPMAAIVGHPVTPVATRYLPLNAYLEHQHASSVVLTFEQIESLLGFSLPAPASMEREWWTAQAGHIDGHADTWTAAGRTATPNLLAHTVAFTRSPSQRPQKEHQCLHHDGAGL